MSLPDEDGGIDEQAGGFTTETREEAELKAAKHYFSTGEFGAPAKYVTPFTEQLMVETEIRFPVDGEQFAKARRTQRFVLRTYLGMRLTTILFFTSLVFLQCLVFERWWTQTFGADARLPLADFVANVLSGRGVTATIITIAVLGVFFFMARICARFFVFWSLTRRAEQLSFQVFKRIDDIETRVTEACSKVRLRVGENWPRRAKNWIVIALWSAKRAEYLDRFISTVIWRVATYMSQMQNFFFVLKVSIVVIFLMLMGVLKISHDGFTAASIFTVFLLAQAYFLWHRVGQKPRHFWTNEFRRHAPSADADIERYSDKISDEIENLVHEVISKEFGQAPRNG